MKRSNDHESSNRSRSHGSTKGIRKRIGGITIMALLLASVIAALSISVATVKPFAENGQQENPNPLNLEEIQGDIANMMHGSGNIVVHNHASLSVKMDGRSISIPALVGIDSTLYRDHSLDSFGLSDPLPVAPLHTHNADGLIHIEATSLRDYTLGDFLKIWGMNGIEGKNVKLTINGNLVALNNDADSSDYLNHVLKDGQDILLEFE